MIGLVYVIDFGVVRKVGFSRNFEKRVLELTKQFRITPLICYTMAAEDPSGVELKLKEMLKPHIVPYAGYKVETFSTSYKDCVDALINAEIYVKENPDDIRRVKLTCSVSQETREIMDSWGGSRGEILDKLIEAEDKRLREKS